MKEYFYPIVYARVIMCIPKKNCVRQTTVSAVVDIGARTVVIDEPARPTVPGAGDYKWMW
jgi:hypothetical protein